MMDVHYYINKLLKIINLDSIQIAYDNFKNNFEDLNREKRIIIYGAGARGTDLNHFLESFSIEVDFFLIRKRNK